MIAKIGLGLLAIVIVLLIAIAARPASFRIERSATIAAPAEIVFAQLNDFHRWEKWNPFEQSDTTMQKTFEGVPSSIGSSYHYVSDKAGEGRMTLTQAVPHELVAVKAEFIKPFAATNQIEFTLTPVAEGVSVTWAMRGENNFIGKAISLFMNADKMIGTEFEKGLSDLKHVSEEEAERRVNEAKVTEAATSVQPATAG